MESREALDPLIRYPIESTNAAGWWRASLIRKTIAVAWPSALIAALFLRLAPYGYNPTDDGNVLAQTYRILHGQIPHKDVIFARPMGSALLHTLDFALPLPLFKASRLVGITEVVAYSSLLAILILRKPLSRWGVPIICLVVASTLVNLHTFPLMGWYTTDGLLFVAAGLVLLILGLDSGRDYAVNVGLLALGIAPVMKQSFFAGPLIALLIVVWRARGGSRRRVLWVAFRSLVLVVLPFLTYAIVISAFGGFQQLVRQLTQVHDVQSVFGNAILHPQNFPQTLALILIFLGSALILRLTEVRANQGLNFAATAALYVRIAISALLVLTPIAFRFGYYEGWSIALFWALMIFGLSDWLTKRRVNGSYLLIALVAWMSSLSWGYGIPALMGGTVLLATLHCIWHDETKFRDVYRSRGRFLVKTIAIVLVAVFAAIFLHDHDRSLYFDRPKSELTASLDAVAPGVIGIRTNPTTARYLLTMTDCVKERPAKWTAVLPDNAGIYPALHLRNPFPIDWMYPAEVQGEEARILQAAERLNSAGNFLVLFQTYSAYELPMRSDVGSASSLDRPFDYGLALTSQIAARLQGQTFTCGPFTGVYRP